MKRQSIAIISIIAVGSLFGFAYSTGTVITNTGIITPSCTGCLTNSVSYSTWSTALNTTIAGTNGNPVIGLQTGTDGSAIVSNSNDRVAIVKLDGTVVIAHVAPSGFVNTGQISSAQSIDGTYKILLMSNSINVYKNNSLLTTFGIDVTQFSGGDLRTVSVSISPDGKYIAVSGEDTGGALNRVVILTGS